MAKRTKSSYNYIPDDIKVSLRDIYRIAYNVDEFPNSFNEVELRQLMKIIRNFADVALARININHDDAMQMSKLRHSQLRDDRLWEPKEPQRE